MAAFEREFGREYRVSYYSDKMQFAWGRPNRAETTPQFERSRGTNGAIFSSRDVRDSVPCRINAVKGTRKSVGKGISEDACLVTESSDHTIAGGVRKRKSSL